VVAIVVLLIWKFSGDSGASPRRTAEPQPAPDAGSIDRTRRRPRPTDGEQVARPDEPVRETIVNGVTVRDHRKGDRPLPELPIAPRPADRKRIPSSVVQDVSTKVQAAMKDCASAIPADARGQKPRLEGVVFVDIKGGELSVTEATVQLRDVSGDVAAVKACIEQKSVGHTIAAKDVEDTTHYSITLSYALPAP
jgi:hypothetical protein